jgi:hypothetical protein
MAKTKIKSVTPAKSAAPSQGVAEKLMGSLPSGDGPILYDKTNYILMVVGVLFIVVGFVLMAGGAHPDPKVFDTEAVYSFQRITLAPILIIIGFIIELVAVLKKPAPAAA